jgi:hypothetical protein
MIHKCEAPGRAAGADRAPEMSCLGADNFKNNPSPSQSQVQNRPGWNPYTAVLAVRADEKALGELVTFTSASWGGRNAFQKLVNPYRLKQRLQFPICELATRDRGDENRNIDPVFKIVAWSDCGNFADLLPPPAEERQAIEFKPAAKPSTVAELINDDIPF